MEHEEFGLAVAEHRSSIVRQWSLISGMSQANSAYELTRHGIQKGFVGSRSPVKGELMKGWCVNNTAPLWACKSALSLCLEHGWQPSSPIEWALFAYLFIRFEPVGELEEMVSRLPAGLSGVQGGREWLMLAIEDRDVNRNKKNK